MSLIVGVALGAAAVIALISGNVLGLAAANGWTKLAWAIAAAILLFNALLPRRRTEVPVGEAPVARGSGRYRDEDRTVADDQPRSDEGDVVTRPRDEDATAHEEDEQTTRVHS